MIDIKELSIGNWIENTNENTGKVIGITEQGEVIVRYSKNSTCYSEPAVLEGIPLTPTILEKNGFSNDFYVNEAIADYHFVRLEGYSLHIKELQQGGDDALVTYCNGSVNIATELNGEINKEIHFIHQLQNALTLCGINKEIEL